MGLLDGRVAIVTGGGSGIGAASARLLAKEGAQVAVLGRTQGELDDVVKGIARDGGEAMPLVADVSKPDEMQRAYEELARTWGRLDIVFANAGINGVWARIEDLTVDEWEKTIAINLTGTFITLKYAVPHLKRQGGGSIIVTSSINGTRTFSNTGATAYSTTKAGQVAITKMLAVELGDDNIRVNVVCPGAIETSIDDNTERRSDPDQERPAVEFPDGNIPLTGGEPGSSEQVAQLVLFLASDLSSHITGTEVWIDGAQSLLVG